MTENIIHEDGIDKTGKDSIRRELIKSSNGKYLIIIRSFLSQIAYSRIYNRNINEIFFFKEMKKASDRNEKFIVLECNSEILEYRFQFHQEKDLPKEEIKKHQEIFNDVVKEAIEKYKIKIFKIDTTKDLVKESVEKIINFVEDGR